MSVTSQFWCSQSLGSGNLVLLVQREVIRADEVIRKRDTNTLCPVLIMEIGKVCV